METEHRLEVPGGGGAGNEGQMLNGYRVSFWENALDRDGS